MVERYPDSKEFCVIGDGACCLNCLAAWIFLDPTQGPALGRDMNTHIAEYRNYYKDKLSFPLTITLAGGERKLFEEGEENLFFDTLVSSPEASYIWRESHDLIALTNFTNMQVEVVVYDQESNKIEEPTQEYNPDPDFPWKEDDANSPNDNHYQKMILLNYKNCHFNLILKEDHPLVRPASLLGIKISTPAPSDSSNVEATSGAKNGTGGGGSLKKNEELSCKICEDNFKNNPDFMNHLKNTHKDEYITHLETKLKEAALYTETVNKEKKESNIEIYRLVEDLEKMKIENKELKYINKGRNLTVKKTSSDSYDKQDEEELDSERDIIRGKQNGFRRNNPQNNSTQVFSCNECEYLPKDKKSLDEHKKRHIDLQIKCMKCGKPFLNDSDLQNHIINDHRKGSQLNCMLCDFQTNQRELLKNHINFKHTEEKNQEVKSCDQCSMQFMTIWNLKNHIRDVHGPQEDCYLYKQNRCKFNKSCWRLHKPGQSNESFTCFSCKENFKTINELMRHRKREHIELCKPCSPKEGSCRFENDPDRCWFLHEDFQQRGNKQAPPIENQLNQSKQLNKSSQ